MGFLYLELQNADFDSFLPIPAATSRKFLNRLFEYASEFPLRLALGIV